MTLYDGKEMKMTRDDGGPAFPSEGEGHGNPLYHSPGMSLRDWFAGQALANPTICTGQEPDWQLRAWFGERGGITRQEIAAKQAGAYADAMLAERSKAEGSTP